MVVETKEVNSIEYVTADQRWFKVPWSGKHGRWLETVVFTVFVLAGQSVATLLGRLYLDKGGNSIWLLTLVQTVGFPALLPLLLLKPSSLILALLYISLGVFLAALCVVYSIGLLYLPVSTYSLICASQLGFNAVFSFFLNQQKLTPFVVNSVFILTLSYVLLVFQNDSGRSTNTLERKYALGFVCTIGASAGYALLLSLTQLSYRTIVKEDSFTAVLAMTVYQSMASSFVIVIGVFVSGDWKSLRAEMVKFELGEVWYVTILVGKAVCWQAFSVGTLGLTFKVSSVFSNVVSTVGLPIVPILAVVMFHDDMNGVKMVSMVMAVWGFVS